MAADKAVIHSITPENPKWGDQVTVNYDLPDGRGVEQAYVLGYQPVGTDNLVAGDGGMPLKTVFQLGPTTLADETQPADGLVRLTVGQNKNPSNDRVLAEYKFHIAPA